MVVSVMNIKYMVLSVAVTFATAYGRLPEPLPEVLVTLMAQAGPAAKRTSSAAMSDASQTNPSRCLDTPWGPRPL